MITIIITTIVVIWLYLGFIIYCAFALKKSTPQPGQNFANHMRNGAT